jgi:hypothetical protein
LATADELIPGDELFIVGRVNDDGTVLARLVKDLSIFKLGVARHVGKILSVDMTGNKLVVDVNGIQDDYTVTYTSTTKIFRHGVAATETDLQVGDWVRVEGVANVQARTVAATTIAASGQTSRPLLRIREMKRIIQHRIRHAAGQETEQDILNEQEED